MSLGLNIGMLAGGVGAGALQGIRTVSELNALHNQAEAKQAVQAANALDQSVDTGTVQQAQNQALQAAGAVQQSDGTWTNPDGSAFDFSKVQATYDPTQGVQYTVAGANPSQSQGVAPPAATGNPGTPATPTGQGVAQPAAQQSNGLTFTGKPQYMLGDQTQEVPFTPVQVQRYRDTQAISALMGQGTPEALQQGSQMAQGLQTVNDYNQKLEEQQLNKDIAPLTLQMSSLDPSSDQYKQLAAQVQSKITSAMGPQAAAQYVNNLNQGNLSALQYQTAVNSQRILAASESPETAMALYKSHYPNANISQTAPDDKGMVSIIETPADGSKPQTLLTYDPKNWAATGQQQIISQAPQYAGQMALEQTRFNHNAIIQKMQDDAALTRQQAQIQGQKAVAGIYTSAQEKNAKLLYSARNGITVTQNGGYPVQQDGSVQMPDGTTRQYSPTIDGGLVHSQSASQATWRAMPGGNGMYDSATGETRTVVPGRVGGSHWIGPNDPSTPDMMVTRNAQGQIVSQVPLGTIQGQAPKPGTVFAPQAGIGPTPASVSAPQAQSKPTLQQFMSAARAAPQNAGKTDAQLQAFYVKNYGQ